MPSQTPLPENIKSTPMMKQWYACKKQARNAVLLFRMGDFYEAFYEDAKILADKLELTLTKRQGVPMSGVPWHASENYIERLVEQGCKVAIAEQMEDPKKAKGLVARKIVRFITPGTFVDSSSRSEKKNNFIVSITAVGPIFGLASLDLSTAEFKVVEIEEEREVINELFRIKPSEIVTTQNFQDKHPYFFKEFAPPTVTDFWHFEHKSAYNFLTEHFAVFQLDGFGLKGQTSAINAAGALLRHIHEDLSLSIDHIRNVLPYKISNSLSLDQTTQRNLELIESSFGGGKSLLKIIDQTKTPMGGRLIRSWLTHPLLSVEKIVQRQDAIQNFYEDAEKRSALKNQYLKQIRDLERLTMKISANLATPRDLLSLQSSLECIAPIKNLLGSLDAELLQKCRENLFDITSLLKLLKEALNENPPLRISDGNIFKDGFHPPLDELREISKNGKMWLSRYQSKIREETGIKNLKVSFNKIFGYYLEVSRGQTHLVPENFQRRQTLVNHERFITTELKEYEQKVFSAEEKLAFMENELFKKLLENVCGYRDQIFSIAKSIAVIDTLVSLADVAKQNMYFCPTFEEEGKKLEITEGRHPVIESATGREHFTANDTFLDDRERLMVITGPNMAGKSTYIRQVALIVILAQIGSFVPAKKVHMDVVDKIFTRIGANDDLSRGLSTFMVEMSETANILNNATPRSLVILDEIGRGTSTYDGVAIAWAVAEYLLTDEKKRDVKTLFATHYFELTKLEKENSGAKNYHAKVEETRGEIVFLHKILRGKTDRSYGIHVARLAGLPLPVIARAQKILERLETRAKKNVQKKPENLQLSLF